MYEDRRMDRQLAPPAPHFIPPGALCVRVAVPLGALAALVFALVATGWQPLLELDRRTVTGLHGPALRHPGWTHTNRVLTDWVWDPVTMRIVLAAAAGWLLVRGERLLALWVVATAAVTTGIQQGLKWAFDRERPRWAEPVDSAHYAALPSGHAMTAAVTCALLLWLVHRAGAGAAVRWTVWTVACVSVAGVSFTRVWLGVHWPTDTVAGVLLGLALTVTAIAGWNALAARRRWQDGAPAGRIPA